MYKITSTNTIEPRLRRMVDRLKDWSPIENSLRTMINSAHISRVGEGDGSGDLMRSIAAQKFFKLKRNYVEYGTDLPYATHNSWHRHEKGETQLVSSITEPMMAKFVDFVLTGRA